uniref:Olfactory receptor 5F1-like n=1 Tax=Phascolarctos cinereus TaxID=38626 RepID=A0A6P5JGI6_PHACI|nr:olfactory receptor 5F1-like [Phascolarctos cinereus]
MSGKNDTAVTEFILLGLTDSPGLQITLFVLFLVIYTLTMMGNAGMITLIMIDSQLHTPMYFFLTSLSLADIFYSSNITPKMLTDLLSERKVISFAGCFVQMYVFIALAATEHILFGLMAYDRYVAICNPLLYPVIMSRTVCLKMATGAFTAGFLNSIIHTSYISSLSFCGSNVIHHFFCDTPPVLKLSCSDTQMNETMSVENHTAVTEFILLGLTDSPELQVILFVLFLVIYILTTMGNAGMITLIMIDFQLHTPMYFFLTNLSLTDVFYSSTITPKMLADLLSKRKVISFTGCFLQMYVFIALSTTECILFGLMAYDRYVAICNPLLYPVIMSRTVCLKMATGAFTAGFLNSIIHTSYISSLSFCDSNVVHHFFCDSPPILKLSCSDTQMNETIIFICAGINMLGTFLIILTSYVCILFSILRLNSVEGRRKAFSTCASHITAIVIFYGTVIVTYLCPSSSYSPTQGKVISVFYTVVIPMLNPLIYSLRNEEVKRALKNAITRKRIPTFI